MKKILFYKVFGNIKQGTRKGVFIELKTILDNTQVSPAQHPDSNKKVMPM